MVRVVIAGEVAVPPETVPVPRDVAPLKNSTLPVAPDGSPDAVKVTDAPSVEGLAEEPTVIVVEALLTVWVKVVEELDRKFVSPL
jgi:hypothetical protein